MSQPLVQGELFPETVQIRPTIAMQAGESFVAQCSWCGLLVCAEKKAPLGDCPACSSSSARPVAYPHSWWAQDLPVGPFIDRNALACHVPGTPTNPVRRS